MIDIFWCKNCLNTSTRPRISFDNQGFCNACQWAHQKKKINWKKREYQLLKLLDKHRSNSNKFDCLVPVSGGKDGSYVAYQLKHKYGMNPLTVTSRPPLTREIGDINLENFIRSGYDHIHISANSNTMKAINKFGFTNVGMPYYGWLITIFSIPINVAINFRIPLIFYGEDGEVEYGGSTESENTPFKNIDYIKKIYVEDAYEKAIKKNKLKKKENYWFSLPNFKKKNLFKPDLLWWSFFENWDPYRNYLYAKKYCGLKEYSKSNEGTFTNFSQNDQKLYSLHTYLMYLKFGFGRATQDIGIEIRRGAMTRDQGINLVRLYDGQYPQEYLDDYLNYFNITKKVFDNILYKWTNKNFFKIEKNNIVPKFKII
jgi:N-acetyl sugar amidotransferase